jgi:integrase
LVALGGALESSPALPRRILLRGEGDAVKLTATNIHTLKITNGKDEQIHFCDDRPGLGLRLRRTGGRTLIYQYGRQIEKATDNKCPTNKSPKVKICTVGGAMDFGEAVKVYKNLYARVQLGEDPASDKAKKKTAASKTFGAILPKYLAHKRETLRPRPYADVERHLLIHAKPLHPLQLRQDIAIWRQDIAAVITGVAMNSGAPTGKNVRSSLSGFFTWALGQGLLDVNPVAFTIQFSSRSRERVLAPAELRLIWNALANDHYGSIIKLLALTGQRAGEIAGLCWSEVDLEKNAILLPGERTKNHRPHLVPLSAPARAIIAAQPRRVSADGKLRDLIFGLGERAFSGWSNCKERLARITDVNGAPLPHWTPHDLRRSFVTHASELGIAQPHIIEAVVNHVSGHKAGVAGIYNRASYEREKRHALDLWADQLLAWVENRDTSVTALRRPA